MSDETVVVVARVRRRLVAPRPSTPTGEPLADLQDVAHASDRRSPARRGAAVTPSDASSAGARRRRRLLARDDDGGAEILLVVPHAAPRHLAAQGQGRPRRDAARDRRARDRRRDRARRRARRAARRRRVPAAERPRQGRLLLGGRGERAGHRQLDLRRRTTRSKACDWMSLADARASPQLSARRRHRRPLRRAATSRDARAPSRSSRSATARRRPPRTGTARTPRGRCCSAASTRRSASPSGIAAYRPAKLISSTAVRCLQTIAPTARVTGLAGHARRPRSARTPTAATARPSRRSSRSDCARGGPPCSAATDRCFPQIIDAVVRGDRHPRLRRSCGAPRRSPPASTRCCTCRSTTRRPASSRSRSTARPPERIGLLRHRVRHQFTFRSPTAPRLVTRSFVASLSARSWVDQDNPTFPKGTQ